MTSFFDISEDDKVYLIFQSANRTVVRINAAKALKNCLSNHGVEQSQIREITVDAPGNEDLTKQITDLVPANLKSKWPFVFYNTKFIGNNVQQVESWFENSSSSSSSSLPPPGQTPSSRSSGSSSNQLTSPPPASPPLPETASPNDSASESPSHEDSSSPTSDQNTEESAIPASSVETPAKRKRGRPPSALPKPPKPPGPPAKRGRPPSAIKPLPVEPSGEDQVKRKRGRPPSANPAPPKPSPPPGTVAKRGRPPTKPRDNSVTPAPNHSAPPPRGSSQRQADLRSKSKKPVPTKRLSPQESLEAEYEGKNLRGVKQCAECDIYYLKAHNACKATYVKRQRT